MVDRQEMMKAMFGISVIVNWGKNVIYKEKFPNAYRGLSED